MRGQRSSLIITISSTAGLEGGEFLSAYAASKFAVEGWMESLAAEVAPFGIRAMLVEPGSFRTELLTPQSRSMPRPRSATTSSGPDRPSRPGRPWTASRAATPPSSPPPWSSWPPRRSSRCVFAAGADAVTTFEKRAQLLLDQANANRELSSNLAYDET